jgi:hypothetical protein
MAGTALAAGVPMAAILMASTGSLPGVNSC